MIVAFYFGELLLALVWGALLVLNLWIFQKTKARGNLLMIVGAALLALSGLLWAFTGSEVAELPGVTIRQYPDPFVAIWLPLAGAVLLLIGFYFTVKPMVETHIEALKKKLQDVTADKKDTPAAPESPEGGPDGSS